MEEVQNDKHEFYDDDIIDDLNDNDLLNDENEVLRENAIADENEEEVFYLKFLLLYIYIYYSFKKGKPMGSLSLRT